MPGSVRVGGAWKTVAGASVKVGGAWKTVSAAYTKVGGAWKQWYSSFVPVYELIQTQYPSGVSTLTFSGISASYKHLQLRIVASQSNQAPYYLRFNGDTASNYNFYGYRNNGGTVTWIGGITTTVWQIQDSAGNSDTNPAYAIVDINFATESGKWKQLGAHSGAMSNYVGTFVMRGHWQSTAAINSITVFLNTGTFSSGTRVMLYGIKE